MPAAGELLLGRAGAAEGGRDDARAAGGGAGLADLPLRCRKASCSGVYCAPAALEEAAAGEAPRAGAGEPLPPSLPLRRMNSSCSGVYCALPLALPLTLPLAWPLAWPLG